MSLSLYDGIDASWRVVFCVAVWNEGNVRIFCEEQPELFDSVHRVIHSRWANIVRVS